MTTKEHALRILNFSRQFFNDLLEGVPADKLLHSPVPGGNHALWIIGHLAVTDDFFADMVDGQGQKLPQRYRELFDLGSTPTANEADYPPVSEIREQFAAARQRLISAYEAADEDTLSQPLPQELSNFAPNKLGLPLTQAWHEGIHTGQLSSIRRSLGIKPLVG